MSTTISELLQKSIALEKKIDALGESLQELVQRASDTTLAVEKLRTMERSEIIREFVADAERRKKK